MSRMRSRDDGDLRGLLSAMVRRPSHAGDADPSCVTSQPGFSFYLGGPGGNVAVVPPLAQDESARREHLTADMFRPEGFRGLHALFEPPQPPQPLETCAMSNQLETLIEEEAALASDDDAIGWNSLRSPIERRATARRHDREAEETEPRGLARDEEELQFDAEHLSASVHKLVRRIASHGEASNQDDEPSDDHQEEYEGKNTHDTAQDGGNNALLSEPEDDDEHEDELLATTQRSPRPLARPRLSRLYLSDEEDVPNQLTASMRRLIIGLQDDSERAKSDHSPFKRASARARRRGNSCPAPYCPLSPAGPLSPAACDPLSPPRHCSRPGHGEGPPPPPRKKNALSRIAPKFLENLHLRRRRKSYLFTDAELESIEGARWKIVELAFRFGGKHRFYLVQAVNMFAPLTKYGRRGGPHPTRVHCNHCGTLQWQHKRGGRLSEAVDLADVLHVVEGRRTAVFRKYGTSARLEACSFSIILEDRTLDLETQSASYRDWLMSALRTLVSYAKRQRQAEQQAIAERKILPLDDFVALSPRAPPPPPASVSIRAV